MQHFLTNTWLGKERQRLFVPVIYHFLHKPYEKRGQHPPAPYFPIKNFFNDVQACFTSLHKYFCGVWAILKSAASSSRWYPLIIKANSALWICIFFILDTALAKRATQRHFLKFHVSSDSFFEVGPHLCERRLFSQETEKFCVHVLVNQFCHSDAKLHLYRSVCSLKWWFPLSWPLFAR